MDLSEDERVAFVPLGGSTLRHWVAEHYLRPLRRIEAFSLMSAERIRERDPHGEVEGWFRKIGEMIGKL
jgi:hypothetical protein